jgi:hypothetical protein
VIDVESPYTPNWLAIERVWFAQDALPPGKKYSGRERYVDSVVWKYRMVVDGF